jgi:hypothetical protein
MRIQTILNRVEKFKSFVYAAAHLQERPDGPALVVRVRPRERSRPQCSGCGRLGPVYDRLEERSFQFVPVWGTAVKDSHGVIWGFCPVFRAPRYRRLQHRAPKYRIFGLCCNETGL